MTASEQLQAACLLKAAAQAQQQPDYVARDTLRKAMIPVIGEDLVVQDVADEMLRKGYGNRFTNLLADDLRDTATHGPAQIGESFGSLAALLAGGIGQSGPLVTSTTGIGGTVVPGLAGGLTTLLSRGLARSYLMKPDVMEMEDMPDAPWWFRRMAQWDDKFNEVEPYKKWKVKW